jgi:hypothetical protein
LLVPLQTTCTSMIRLTRPWTAFPRTSIAYVCGPTGPSLPGCAPACSGSLPVRAFGAPAQRPNQ